MNNIPNQDRLCNLIPHDCCLTRIFFQWELGLLLLVAAFFPRFGYAWSFDKLLAPSVKDFDFSYTCRIATPQEQSRSEIKGDSFYKPVFSYDPPYIFIDVRVNNRSKQYLEFINIICSFFDPQGNRFATENFTRLSEYNRDGSVKMQPLPAAAPGNDFVRTFGASGSQLFNTTSCQCDLTDVFTRE